jgi:hypothetical protein
MVCVGVFFCARPVFASEEGTAEAVNLTVDRVWMEAEILRIEVTDKRTGVNQTLGVSLREYAGNSEYVSVQAVDMDGNKSNTIQIRNPFYKPAPKPESPPPPAPVVTAAPEAAEAGESASPARPFTPDGTGTVVDNIQGGNGKEFFSIESDDGNVFYLIVDRQRTSENVYLLNPVTEQDLNSLAGQSGVSAVPEPTSVPAPTLAPEPTTEPPAEKPSGGVSGGSVILIIVAALAAGGAGYYFKIIKPKKDGGMDEEDYEEPEDDGGEYDDYGDDPDGGERT